jgi:SAM-dependent methyltransferase
MGRRKVLAEGEAAGYLRAAIMAKSEWHYSGLAAQCYDLWFGEEPYVDQAFFQRRIIDAGGPALEIACGTGRLLVPYLRDRLDVEGLDSSPEMLAICKSKARSYGLTPVLHQQLMQELELPRRRYATIYVPFGSFQILARRDEAFEALRRFHGHLLPGGQVLISLFVPWSDFRLENQWRLRRSGTRPTDGALIHIYECTRSNRLEQEQTIWLRFEVYKNGRLIDGEMRTHQLRWYHKYEFELMLETVGFDTISVFGDSTESPATDRHKEMIFSARAK